MHSKFGLLKLVLFALIAACYALNFRAYPIGDSLAHLYQAASLAWSGDFNLDEYRSRLVDGAGALPYFAFEQGGHLWSIFNFFPGVALAPFLWLCGLAGGESFRDSPAAWGLAAKAFSSLLALGSAWLLWDLLERRVRRPVLVLTVAAFALGSPLWPGSIAYMQTQPLVFFKLAALLAIFGKGDEAPQSARLFAGGLLLGLSVVSRYQTVLSVAVLAIMVIIRYRRDRRALAFIAGCLLPLPATLAYHRMAFGSIAGHEPAFWLAFNFPIWKGIAGLLINPSKGLLVHSPWILFCAPAIWVARRSENPSRRWLAAALALSAVPTFILYGKLNGWFGGWSWGYRYLSDLLPEFAILAALGIDRVWGRVFFRCAAEVAVALSIVVQGIGSLAYDGEWHRLFDLGIGPRQRWVWQVRESQITFDIRRGTVHLPWRTLQLWPNPYKTQGVEAVEHWPGGDFAWTGKEARFLYVASAAPSGLTVVAPPDPDGAARPVRLTVEDGSRRADADLLPGTTKSIPLDWIPFQHGAVLHLSVDRTFEEKPGGRQLGVALAVEQIRRVE